MTMSEEVKESPKMEKISETKIAPPKIVRTEEEEESEALPISDVVAKVLVENAYATPVAHATRDDNDTKAKN
ncbi:hypothetical protein CsSME_00048284 [Camellia sinensis var. sinensis]